MPSSGCCRRGHGLLDVAVGSSWPSPRLGRNAVLILLSAGTCQGPLRLLRPAALALSVTPSIRAAVYTLPCCSFRPRGP